MDEILELQQQLAAAQKGSTAQKLSERNCVELVTKLQDLKLIDIIFTRTGKEYVTPQQLVTEIEDELLIHGGRINVIDLPDILNVDLVHIQAKIPEVIGASREDTRLVRGELLTGYYLASTAEEINDFLTSSENGTDTVGAIAARYSLPVEVVREVVRNHLNTVIHASVDSVNADTLRSAVSIARDQAASRGLLRATTAPILLAELASLRDLPLAVLSEVALDMLNAGELDGHVSGRGSGAFLVPAVFANAATEAVVSAFGTNGFANLDWVKRLHILDVNTLITEHLQSAIVLNECIVRPTLIDTLATSASEAVAGGSWLDVEVGLPPGFPRDDIGAIITSVGASLRSEQALNDNTSRKQRLECGKMSRLKRKEKMASNALKKGAITEGAPLIYASRFVVSPALIKALEEKVTADAVEKATCRARTITEQLAMVVTHAGTTVRGVRQDTSTESSKKGKGRSRRRTSGKEKGNRNDTTSLVPSADDVMELILLDDVWAKIIETDFVGESSAGEDMLVSIIEAHYGDEGLNELYCSQALEVVENLMNERATANQEAEKSLLTLLADAELYDTAANSLPDDDMEVASRAWIVDNICSAALCQIVHAVAQSTGVMEASTARAHEFTTKKERVEVIQDVVHLLAPTLETKIRKMLSVVINKGGDTVSDFLDLYDQSATVLDLPVRKPLDENGRKAAHASARAALHANLDENKDLSETEALKIAAVLVHSNCCGGTIIQIPADEAGSLCKAVEEEATTSDLGDALRKLRMSLSNAESGLSTEFAEQLHKLRAAIS